VDAQWLSERLNEEKLVVLDVRSGIDNGGDRSSFQKSHIPGSVYSNYTNNGWRETRAGVAGLIPPVRSLERLIGSLGIANSSIVVLVPAGTGPTDFGSAARVYWTFKVLGHESVTILNGGLHGAFGFTAGMRAQLLLFGVTSLIMLHSGMDGLVAVAPAPCPSTRD